MHFNINITSSNIEKIILIISGKGGVGKSTIAANIALLLANTGYTVGLLDADIYGPSIPKIFGINKKIKINTKCIVKIRLKLF